MHACLGVGRIRDTTVHTNSIHACMLPPLSIHNASTCVYIGSGQLVKVSNCACIGDILTYKCTVTGPGYTVWQGSAFECPGNNIQLRHSSYVNGTMGQCNDGLITGHSLGVSNNIYTSELNITVSTGLTGRIVECVHRNMTMNRIGSLTIEVTG